MTIHDIKRLVEEGEGYELEFKRKVSTPQKIAKTISSFANTKGGIILFGVDDDGSLVGVESEKTEKDLIIAAGSEYCTPPVDVTISFVPYYNREIIVVIIDESMEKPHWVQDEGEQKVFIRVEDNSVLASKEVIKVLRDEFSSTTGLKLIIGENEKRLFAYLDAHSRITVNEYADLINVSKRRASRILTTLVRAGVVRIHTLEKTDYFTSSSPSEESSPPHTKQFQKRRKH